MKKLMNWLMEEESGQGLVEYALIVALVALAVIGGVTAFGGSLNTWWNNLDNKLSI